MTDAKLAELESEEDRLWNVAFATKLIGDAMRAHDFSLSLLPSRTARQRIDRARSAMRLAVSLSSSGGNATIRARNEHQADCELATLPINAVGDALMAAIEKELAAAVKEFEETRA